jgi:hypothetical protein
MLVMACLNGFNTLIVANVISAALLLFTYADKVSFITHSTMVTSVRLCPLPIAVSISRSPIRALSSTDRWSVISVNSFLYPASGGLAIAPLVAFSTLASQKGMQISSGFLIRSDREEDLFMADIIHRTRLLMRLIVALGASPA